mmetsp:Transcript_36954/g.95425  ORF Transcript_36954/g.95425 Transcript_36954/m.95425 type:complete len:597 (-) Transcript_36954:470-2260(-)
MQDLPAPAAKREVHPCEDILRQVQRLRGFGDPALLHTVLLVHEVWVAVVHARTEQGPAPLLDCAEGLFGARGEVADGANVAGDVLREADDALRPWVSTLARPKLAQDARQQHHLLEVRSLVGVNALSKDATHKGDRVVLVVALAVPQDRIPRQLDAPARQPPAVAIRAAAPVDEAAEVSAPLPWVHVVDVRIHVFVLPIDEGHFQTRRELLEHAIRMGELHLVEVLILLHRHEHRDTVARVPHLRPRQAAGPVPLDLVVALQHRMIQAHPRDRAVQRLHPHGGPSADLVPLVVRVLCPLASSRGPVVAALRLHPAREGPELLLVARLHPVDELHAAGHALVLTIALPGEELVFLHEDLLGVVRYEDCEPRDVGYSKRPRHREPKAARERDKAPLRLRVARPGRVGDAEVVLEPDLQGVLGAEDVGHANEVTNVAGASIATTAGAHRWRLEPRRRVHGGVARDVPHPPHTPQRLIELAPGHRPPGVAGIEREITHGLVVTLVLVAHVVDDPVPDHREVEGHVPLVYLLAAVCQRRRVGQHLLREALRHLGDGVLQGVVQDLTRPLHKHDCHAEACAADGEPQLRVRHEQEEGGEPEQ